MIPSRLSCISREEARRIVSYSLAGKVVFVTGASAGIGAAAARGFAREGAKLLLCARRLDALKVMEQELRSLGAKDVCNFELDVRDRVEVESAIELLPDDWKNIEVLVNNAGLSRGLTKLYLDDIQDWEEMIDTNVKGLLYVTRAVVLGMVERGSGHVINLGSIAGHMAYPNGGVYCGTKAAERLISDGLRLDLNGTPVRVTSVDPGMVKTDFSKVRFRGNEERAAKTYENVEPLTAEDIADVIVWTATRPAHVQIQTVVLTPVAQANPFVLTRGPLDRKS
jgi:3-hydroxy acid dehydrogenase/malonic semialdehyde reductase